MKRGDSSLGEYIFALTSFPKYLEAVYFLQIQGIEKIGHKILQYQYKQFIRILSKMTEETDKIDPVQVVSQLMSSFMTKSK